MNDYVVQVDDLEELHRCGAVHLPTVAIQYSELASALHKTALSDGGTFNRSINGPSPVGAAFAALRARVQDEIAVRSYENLIASGEVLMKIADSFANTDYLNAAEIEEYQEYLGSLEDPSTPDYERPPWYVPEPPSTDDPHPELTDPYPHL